MVSLMSKLIKFIILVLVVYILLDLLFIRRNPLSTEFILLYFIHLYFVLEIILGYYSIISKRLFPQFFILLVVWFPVIILGYRSDIFYEQFNGSLFDYFILLFSKYFDILYMTWSMRTDSLFLPSLMTALLFFLLGIYITFRDDTVFEEKDVEFTYDALFYSLLLIGYSPFFFIIPHLTGMSFMTDLPKMLNEIFKKENTTKT